MAAHPTQVPAIYAPEAETLLDRLGAGEAYRAGELRCESCGDPINGHGLGTIALQDDEIRATCARVDCREQHPTR